MSFRPVVLLWASALLACSLTDLTHLGPGCYPNCDGGASGDGASIGDGGGNADGPNSGCPGTGGPTPVHITSAAGGYCIDSTEVTNRQYASFLTATGGGTAVAGQPAYCSWNASYVPGNGPPTANDDPVVNVDWCDAYAFCAWAGKHLCGAIRGGTNAYGASADPSSSAWFSACSHGTDGQHTYPYGNTYGPSTCNSSDLGANGLVPVGTLPGCTGGYPGIADMAGNVEEWEDSCNGTAGASDECWRRGGSWQDRPGDQKTRCDFTYTGPLRSQANDDVGFRCCSP